MPPSRNEDCADPGLSISTSVVAFGSVTDAVVGAGTSRRAHPPNSACARRSTSSGFTSPTTSSVALFGA